MSITDGTRTAITRIPVTAWIPAYDAEGRVREGTWVAEITGMVDLTGRPEGVRLIVPKELPHPGGTAAHRRLRRQPIDLLGDQHPHRTAR